MKNLRVHPLGRGMEALCGLLVSLSFCTCTEPNPAFSPSGNSVNETCEQPGERRCDGSLVKVCNANQRLLVERICPTPSTCQGGLCSSPGIRCTNSCENGQVCTIFVDPEDTSTLGTFCADKTGNLAGGIPCQTSEKCDSGFCLTFRNESRCYKACEHHRDCADEAQRCELLQVTIDGVRGQVNACVTYTATTG